MKRGAGVFFFTFKWPDKACKLEQGENIESPGIEQWVCIIILGTHSTDIVTYINIFNTFKGMQIAICDIKVLPSQS